MMGEKEYQRHARASDIRLLWRKHHIGVKRVQTLTAAWVVIDTLSGAVIDNEYRSIGDAAMVADKEAMRREKAGGL